MVYVHFNLKVLKHNARLQAIDALKSKNISVSTQTEAGQIVGVKCTITKDYLQRITEWCINHNVKPKHFIKYKKQLEELSNEGDNRY
jgi:hypothetical protein